MDDAELLWMFTNSSPAKEQNVHMRKALGHQQELQRFVSVLLAKNEALAGDMTQSHTVSAVHGAQRELDGLHGFFSTFLSPAFYNERIPDRSNSTPPAQGVFEVVELLELILGYLTIRDIMSFQQINRSAYDTIESSPRLRDMLSLRAESSRCSLPDTFCTLFAWA
ncbi:hypothetical protein LTR85_008290 [Meristemomyces frigidus]|nr:hypothetical protein LTR85_008290 [Meristemomyces frigidus]